MDMGGLGGGVVLLESSLLKCVALIPKPSDPVGRVLCESAAVHSNPVLLWRGCFENAAGRRALRKGLNYPATV